mgnify:CR=1 FL=1
MNDTKIGNNQHIHIHKSANNMPGYAKRCIYFRHFCILFVLRDNCAI